MPKLRASPPTGEGWLYELKFDGYRVQLHKAGLFSSIYGKNGGDFPNANDLLAECTRLGLEGIVCKRKDAPYRSGSRSGWIKVKTPEWEAANRYRAKLFEKT